MASPIQRMTAAWRSADRTGALPSVTEELAAAGVSKAELESALGELLDRARSEGVDENTEEIILGVGDRLHGWCPADRRIQVNEAAEVQSAAVVNRPFSPTQPAGTSPI